ncbi:VOC family protein [Geomonas sp.]|uniref:VOC family protein n=1 Tax=Geomonas sp. TaxID=2651584 RepID=UPI002B47E107|nr:VOC family protein [Geomonas sp.]HJV34842.1 VOC family protein [Geomonas sp.]
MEMKAAKITPFLWFNNNAEEAVKFYTSVFPHSKVVMTTRYTAEGAEVSGMPKGSVMTVSFELQGQKFVALNGGPHFKFTEAVSFVVNCDSQQEIDYYWEKLSEGGDRKAQQCGWLKDKYGLSWQIVPSNLGELLSDPEPGKTANVMKALIRMKKLDVDALQKAKLNGQVEYPEFQN